MRIFGGDKVTGIMDALKVDENTPIQSKMLSNIIESSQKKIEGRNFNIRKNVLNYDDVMNTQREIIYSQRQKVLDGEDVHDYIVNMINQYVVDSVDAYLMDDDIKDDWNLSGLREHLMGLLTTEDDFNYTVQELDELLISLGYGRTELVAVDIKVIKQTGELAFGRSPFCRFLDMTEE